MAIYLATVILLKYKNNFVNLAKDFSLLSHQHQLIIAWAIDHSSIDEDEVIIHRNMELSAVELELIKTAIILAQWINN